MAKAYKCSNCGEALVLGESLFGTIIVEDK